MIDNPKQSSRKDLSLKCESDFGEEEWIKQIEVTVRESGEKLRRSWESVWRVTSRGDIYPRPFSIALFNRPRVYAIVL